MVIIGHAYDNGFIVLTNSYYQLLVNQSTKQYKLNWKFIYYFSLIIINHHNLNGQQNPTS